MQRQIEMYLQFVLLPGIIKFEEKNMDDFFQSSQEIKYLFSVIGLIRNENEKKEIEQYIKKEIDEILDNFKEDNPHFKNVDIKIKPEVVSVPEKENMIRWENMVDESVIKKYQGNPLTLKSFADLNLENSGQVVKILSDYQYIVSTKNNSYCVSLEFKGIKEEHRMLFKPEEIDIINSLLKDKLREQGIYFKIESYYNSLSENKDYTDVENLNSKISNLIGFEINSSAELKKLPQRDTWPANVLLSGLSNFLEYANKDAYKIIKKFSDKLGLSFLQQTLVEYCYNKDLNSNFYSPKKIPKKMIGKKLIQHLKDATDIIKQVSELKENEKIAIAELMASTDIYDQDFFDSLAQKHDSITIITEGGEDYLLFTPSPENELTEVVVAGQNKEADYAMITEKHKKEVGGIDFDPDHIKWSLNETLAKNIDSPLRIISITTFPRQMK